MVYLLETATRQSQNYDHERKLIQLFWPQLASRIDPAEFVSRLYAAKVITMEDMQAINSKHNNVGSQAGAVVLLERIQCRREPEYWYETLLDIMMKNGLDDLVKEMEPDIYTGTNRHKMGRRQITSIDLKNYFDHIKRRISLTVTVSVLNENHHKTVTLTS